MVVTGNPPYNYESKNKGEWITNLNFDYFFFNGDRIKEKQPRALNDDYVKFIRFAQWKIDQVDQGIVAIITNHSFLDNLTCRGMRQAMASTFNEMYIFDLHGNSYKKETSPSGSIDENVFDIRQGVCILILVKSTKRLKSIKHCELYGLRSEKYRQLNSSSIKSIEWVDIIPNSRFDFTPSMANAECSYEKFFSIQDIFIEYGSGIKTARDDLAIQYTQDEVARVVIDLASMSNDDARAKYLLRKDTEGWNVDSALRDLRQHNCDKKYIIPILFRQFDVRYTFYTGKSNGFISRPGYRLMFNMLFDNFGLVTTRQVAEGTFNHINATKYIIDMRTTISNKGCAYLFPMYLIEEDEFLGSKQISRRPNIKQELFETLKEKYNKQSVISPETIMGYIYSVLHSPTYRQKYVDYLKTDFPRIPFCEDFVVFEQMSALGWELINAHLMKSADLKQKYPDLGSYTIKGSNEVTKLSYSDHLQRLYINGSQYFDAIPEPVYQFHIGGYQVLNKYLKDRKGRVLTLDEINNVEFIAKILAFTMETMIKIDTASKSWI